MDKGNYEIDHIDRDKTNNYLLNLRLCSTAENCRNKGITKSNSSGFKGVSWHKTQKKWLARIRVDNKLKHLGCFNSKEEAYKAYCEASKEYHKDYGYCP